MLAVVEANKGATCALKLPAKVSGAEVLQIVALPLGQGIADKYSLPLSSTPSEMPFWGTVTLQIIAPPGST